MILAIFFNNGNIGIKSLTRRIVMGKVIDILKNMFLDLLSMGKGFLYGFIMVGLFIFIVGALLGVILYVIN